MIKKREKQFSKIEPTFHNGRGDMQEQYIY